MQILALRSKYAYLAVGGVFDENRNVSASETSGTNVDTSA
jgi:hypothetical protein